MRKLKFQFEVRYTPILNFYEINRRILSPFLKLAEASINNNENGEESIVLIFKEDRYVIDCRWNRLIFISEIDRNDLSKENGPLVHFYNILSKYKQSESFGKITDMILASWSLKEDTRSFTEVVKDFKMKYLSNIPTEFYDPTEIGIILESEENNRFTKLHFGPFNGTKDLEKLKIFQLSKDSFIEFSTKTGILIELVERHKTIDVEIEQFSRMSKKHNIKLNGFR